MGNVSVIAANQFRPSGNYWTQLSAPAVVKSSPGALCRVSILVAGTGGGALTFNDANSLVTAQTITGITAAANAVVTVSTGGSVNPFAEGGTIAFSGVGGMTQINAVYGTVYAIGGVTTAWTITTSINSTNFSAFTSGGTCASYSLANELFTLPESSSLNAVSTVLALEAPCLQGIICSAAMSAALVANVSWN
jgi:hypothetical protein